jgi:hypothetical protein
MLAGSLLPVVITVVEIVTAKSMLVSEPWNEGLFLILADCAGVCKFTVLVLGGIFSGLTRIPTVSTPVRGYLVTAVRVLPMLVFGCGIATVEAVIVHRRVKFAGGKECKREHRQCKQ